MEVAVVSIEGKETGRKAKLDNAVFGIEPNEHAIYLDVKSHLANKRQGTHQSKERGEIVGSTRKIKKQKGTGTARAGSIKNPLFRGGGRVFGPLPRDYSQKVNKKVKRLARKSALSMKAQEKAIIVVEDFQLDGPNKNVYLSSRNLKHSDVVTDSELNTYKITNATRLILSESAIANIESTLNK
jgi:large subunit ribosomal protein L4